MLRWALLSSPLGLLHGFSLHLLEFPIMQIKRESLDVERGGGFRGDMMRYIVSFSGVCDK